MLPVRHKNTGVEEECKTVKKLPVQHKSTAVVEECKTVKNATGTTQEYRCNSAV
jgi:hypothetical protein